MYRRLVPRNLRGEGEDGRRAGQGEKLAVAQSPHRPQPAPQGSSELAWPLRVPLTGGEGPRPSYPCRETPQDGAEENEAADVPETAPRTADGLVTQMPR